MPVDRRRSRPGSSLVRQQVAQRPPASISAAPGRMPRRPRASSWRLARTQPATRIAIEGLGGHRTASKAHSRSLRPRAVLYRNDVGLDGVFGGVRRVAGNDAALVEGAGAVVRSAARLATVA